MSDTIFLPTLSHWQHKNPWTGSVKNARFSIKIEDNVMNAEIWKSKLSRQFIEETDKNSFDISQDGIEKMRLWIEEKCKIINE